MRAFTTHLGVAAPLLRANIDTDSIIPSREMTQVSKKGLGVGLFAPWRYRFDGASKIGDNSDFVLNKPEYAGATILLAGPNFGCGSSREHAVWALADYGIRVVIAPSFGAIFYANCLKNSLLPIQLDAEKIAALVAIIERDPQKNLLQTDLIQCKLECTESLALPFEIDARQRRRLLDGVDDIAATLMERSTLDDFKSTYLKRFAWSVIPPAEN